MAKRKFSEQAKNGADTSAFALPDLSKMADTDKVTVVSEKRAGKTVVGIGKTPVVFDKDGRAEVTAREAKYFLSIDGFELDGAETETDSDTENGGSESGADVESETPENTENAVDKNSGTGNETHVGGDDSEKSEENKDDSEKAAEADSDTEKAGAKKNAKGNK